MNVNGQYQFIKNVMLTANDDNLFNKHLVSEGYSLPLQELTSSKITVIGAGATPLMR